MTQVASNATTVFNVGGTGEVLTLRDESITLTDPVSKRVIASPDSPRAGGRSFSYSIYDPTRAAWIESVIGRDGNVDLRITEIPGHQSKTEFRVGERWLERVDRDGKTGTILDGRFMSIAECRREAWSESETLSA